MTGSLYRFRSPVGRRASDGRLEPSLEQWRALYQAADEVKRIRPWEKLRDTDILTLQLPDREPVFLSVMGKGRDYFGVGVYPGYRSLSGLSRILNAPRGEPAFITFSYQNGLLCQFGRREELSRKDLRVIKLLGLKYRGKDQWTYFRTIHTGFCPWQPDACEADLLTTALRQLLDAYRDMEEDSMPVDFKKQTLLRRYCPERRCWETVSCEKLSVYKYARPVIIRDELFVARLKRMKMTQRVLSLDVIFIPYAMHGKGIPSYPKVLLLLDETTGKVLCQRLFEAGETEERLIPEVLKEYILKNGRPYSLYVRDDRVGRIVEDLCAKIGVRLIRNLGMPTMDEVAESLVDYMMKV